MKLRPYQEDGRRDIWHAWEQHDLLFYVCATGGGKTVTFVEVIREFLKRGMRTMLIAHREELITQAYDTLFSERILSGTIMGSAKTNYDLPSQICSIQTIARRTTLPHADLIVIDEGHHVTDDNSYAKILQRYPDAKVLIVSATPYRLSGAGFQHIIKEKETHLIVNATLRQLIKDSWLVPIRYFLCSMPDMSKAHTKAGDWIEEEAYDAMKLAPIVDSYLEHANGMQGICFAVNVAHSIDIVAQYTRAGVHAVHLDANTPSEDYERDGDFHPGRRTIIRLFRAGIIKVVCNVGIFTEGTDFPNCRFVQLARPTKSLSMFLQMVGRGTRAEKGLVDQFDSAEMRALAIAASSKPDCLVLDNAGLWLEHGMPDAEINWEEHFIGRKKIKKPAADGELEMMVWVAEDNEGNRVRTFNAQEVVGLRLVEVTTAVRSKLVNLKSVAHFDKLYAQMKRVPQIKKPGYTAITAYIKHCNKENILMVPELWNYLHQRCCLEPKERAHIMQQNHDKGLHAYPPDMLARALKRIQDESVSERWLIIERDTYTRANGAQMAEHAMSQNAAVESA